MCEVVWSQRDVANAGGVSAVEAMRLGGVESYAIPAPVVAQSVASAPSLDVSAAIAASAAAAPPKEKYLVMLAENYTDIAKIKRQVGWDRAVVEIFRPPNATAGCGAETTLPRWARRASSPVSMSGVK